MNDLRDFTPVYLKKDRSGLWLSVKLQVGELFSQIWATCQLLCSTSSYHCNNLSWGKTLSHKLKVVEWRSIASCYTSFNHQRWIPGAEDEGDPPPASLSVLSVAGRLNFPHNHNFRAIDLT